jgi:sugar O-acyltransferase (sialic acid O-acetyltransferase NeuD family)
MKRLLILGAGGHGKVVADAALLAGWEPVAFLDDRGGDAAGPLGLPVLGGIETLGRHARDFDAAVVAIGAARKRLELLDLCTRAELALGTVIHPSAVVSRHASLEPGCVVFANAVINAGARLGRGCIVNTGATVDHDCWLGDGVHLCPGTHLAGNVRVGDRAWIGIGAVVRQQLEIGADVMVGAGAVVVAAVPSGKTVVGVPARIKDPTR